jgi:hypothetical protein
MAGASKQDPCLAQAVIARLKKRTLPVKISKLWNSKLEIIPDLAAIFLIVFRQKK